ncbi:MAG TPA: hypothetical protein VHS78_05635 [Candidatus Elarobacter sp.]|nr:hypothetical protein [Candidatus Elarobacter sp.]
MQTDALTAERIGLTWLRAALAPVGAFGRRHDQSVRPYGPGDEVRARDEIADVVSVAERLDRDDVGRLRAALRAVPEPSAIVARARAGDPLGDVDFYELGRFVDAATVLARVWDAAGGEPDRRPPVLEPVRALLAPGRSGGEFYLADAFAPGLREARAALAAAEARYDAMRATIAARVRDALGIDPVGEEFVVLRDDYDGALPGCVTVVRETPTYRAARLRVTIPERDDAFARLATAEEGARRDLAEQIARLAGEFAAASLALGALDRLLARVAFTQRWGGCVPYLADEIAVEHGVFPPLAEALQARARRYTELTISLRGVAVLTGPNMGGKTAALSAVGFWCGCAVLGVPPPARRATLPLHEQIAWIGGQGPADRARLLSSYAAEVVRARDVLADASPRTLVLVDEFARTTGPREGRALLVAFAAALRERGAHALVATHFDAVAEAADVPHLRVAGLRTDAFRHATAADLDEALAVIDAAIDHRIVPAAGAEAESHALSLARLLGLEPSVIAHAEALYRG